MKDTFFNLLLLPMGECLLGKMCSCELALSSRPRRFILLLIKVNGHRVLEGALLLGVSPRVLPDEISIGIGRLSNVDCLPQFEWSSSNTVRA